MKHCKPLLLLLFFLYSHANSQYQQPSPPSPAPAPAIKAAYWPSWTSQALPPSSINFSLFTHIYYAFVQLNATTFELAITPYDQQWLPIFTSTVHSHYPPLKALLSIGGGASNTTTFSNLINNSTTKTTFITSSISISRSYNLDGLDLDWEFPITDADMSLLGDLYKELRVAVNEEALISGKPPLLLTSAVYYAPKVMIVSPPAMYPVRSMAENLDWINAMCFDYHGGWEKWQTGAHAELYDPKSNVSTSYGIMSWINEGMPEKKVVMGLPLYGRTWTLVNESEHGIGAPANGVGPGVQGVMVVASIEMFNRERIATVVYDVERVAAYSFACLDWIGYDNEKSVSVKVVFAKELGLGGYFFWALGQDDIKWSISEAAWVAWEEF
ncbi:class V chitinase CHIT5-like [Dioscorea cayenensis subsp. rotundata]|uniref:Class V chitinase CHIT5-like n=1 Tax=Dioscorea cayennensis subsp. rotundata TaxID=55577 RepID=A0AB40BTP6_DIOCR|nr:class V chitinase CHIT5-like [Dioscorea cayenensis subsp. rotundata]